MRPAGRGRRSALLGAGVIGLLALAVSLPGLTAGVAGAAPPGIGFDISWPQCGRPFPAAPAFGIVGVNDGKPYTHNPCLGEQALWAAASGLPAGFYVNTANPGVRSRSVDWYAQRSPNPACSRSNEAACAYNYGYNGARHAYAYANSLVDAGPGHTWWLDVETGNSWSATDKAANVASIVGALDFLGSQEVVVGAYSTRYQWTKITGGASLPTLPNWVAGARNLEQAAAFCADRTFTGGPVMLVQWVEGRFDHDFPCPGSDAVLRPAGGPASPPTTEPDLLTALLQQLGLLPKS
ncbi:MAG TPA: hypothetical protein VG455_10525 [Acidimicrobiales bacterium]|nr:hypothetical protein [Acidimicrobiales bacterium]